MIDFPLPALIIRDQKRSVIILLGWGDKFSRSMSRMIAQVNGENMRKYNCSQMIQPPALASPNKKKKTYPHAAPRKHTEPSKADSHV